MFEYLSFRCCMCPNTNSPQNTVCPTSLHGGPTIKEETPCRFVKTYIDDRGAFVSIVTGQSGGSEWYTGRRWTLRAIELAQRLELDILPTRKSFDQAQSDLNAYAKANQWIEVTPDIVRGIAS